MTIPITYIAQLQFTYLNYDTAAYFYPIGDNLLNLSISITSLLDLGLEANQRSIEEHNHYAGHKDINAPDYLKYVKEYCPEVVNYVKFRNKVINKENITINDIKSICETEFSDKCIHRVFVKIYSTNDYEKTERLVRMFLDQMDYWEFDYEDDIKKCQSGKDLLYLLRDYTKKFNDKHLK